MLPSAVIPLTSIITKLVYNQNKGADVIFNSNKSEHIPIDEISEYVTEKNNPKNIKGINFVEAGYPSEYLRQGIVLIDTPGIGSTFEHNTASAYNFLPQMDAGIFVISVDPPLSDAEYRYLDSIKAYIDRIFFLLNKIDTMSEQECEESLNFTKALIEKKLSIKGVRIFPVSAKQALDAKLSKNTYLYEKSGFRKFEDGLDQFIKQDKLETLIASTKNKTINLSKELMVNIHLIIKAANSTIDELKNKISMLRSEVGKIEKKHREMTVLLEGEIRSLKTDIENAIDHLIAMSSETLKQGIASLSLNNKNKKEIVEFLNNYLKQGIEKTFSTWFKTEEQNVSDNISKILMDYAKAVEEEINNVKQAAANLFDISIEQYEGIAELDTYSRLWYKVDDILTWGIDNIPLVLPKFFFINYITKQTENRIDEEIDRNAGRARYDLFRRIDSTKEKFIDEMESRKSTVTGGILSAVTRAEQLKTMNEPDAQGKLKTLEGYLGQLKTLGM